MKSKILLPLCAVASVSSCSTDNKDSISKPNVIFILADDLGYGDVSCFNNESVVKTPNIDGIAEAGVRMTQAYASPVSSPTRSMYLTGLFPQRSGVYGNHDGTIPGIGEYRGSFTEDMQVEGYGTAWFGKWHEGWDLSNHPMNNGFDTGYGFLGGMHDFYDPNEGSHAQLGGPYSPNAFIFDGFRKVDTMEYFTTEITNRAISYIEENKDDPFYIFMAYNAPHTPLQAPDSVILKYLRMGEDAENATRYAMIDVMDSEIGRILATLETAGIDDNTLVVFMSDNGPETDAHSGGLRGKKMTMWEGGIRVPLVAKLPNVIPAGGESDAICSIVDMASTFIGLAKGQQTFSYGDGKSLIPYFKKEVEGNVHDNLVFSLNPKVRIGETVTSQSMQMLAVRMKDWKLVKHVKLNVDALYNLVDDPKEQVDLSAKYPEIKQQLLDYADTFLADCPSPSGPAYSKDTRARGDSIKRDSIIRHCKELLERASK